MIDWRAQHALKNATDYLNYVIFELQNTRKLQQEMIDSEEETADETEKEFDQFDAEQIEYLINSSIHIRKMIEILTVKNNTIRERMNAKENA